MAIRVKRIFIIQGTAIPTVNPGAEIFNFPGAVQYGNDINAELLLKATKGTDELTSIILNELVSGSYQAISSNLIGVNGETQTINYSYSKSQVVQDVSLKLVVQDKGGKLAEKIAVCNCLKANYYQALADSPDVIKGKLAEGFTPEQLSFTGHLAASKAENHEYNCTGGKYIYVLYPDEYGLPGTVKTGLFDFSAYTVENVTITDRFGNQLSYKIFYTGYQTGSNVNINIIN